MNDQGTPAIHLIGSLCYADILITTRKKNQPKNKENTASGEEQCLIHTHKNRLKNPANTKHGQERKKTCLEKNPQQNTATHTTKGLLVKMKAEIFCFNDYFCLDQKSTHATTPSPPNEEGIQYSAKRHLTNSCKENIFQTIVLFQKRTFHDLRSPIPKGLGRITRQFTFLHKKV